MLRRFGKDIAIYGASDFVFRLINFSVFPIYAHVFSVEEFGVMSLATTAAGLLAIVGSMGLNSAVQRYYWDPETTAEQRPVVVTTGLLFLFLSCLLVVGLAVAAVYPIRDWLDEKYSLPWLVLLLALVAIVPDQTLQYALDVLRLQFNPWKFALISFLKNLAGVILGLILVLAFGQGLTGLFLGALVAACLVAPVALWTVRTELTQKFDVARARQYVAYGFPLAVSGFAFWIFGAIDRWMLAQFSTVEQVGLYSIAFKFSSILTVVTAAFAQAWSPMVIKMMREDPDGYRKKCSLVLNMWSLVLLLVASGIAMFGLEMLMLLTPEPYWQADNALGMLAAAMAAYGTVQLTAVGISIARATHLIAVGAWIAAIVNVALNAVLIPRYGAEGAAAATLVTYLLLTGMYLFWSQRLHPIPLEYLKLLVMLGILLGSIILVIALRAPHWSLPIFLLKVVAFAMIAIIGFRYVVGISEARRIVSTFWPVRA